MMSAATSDGTPTLLLLNLRQANCLGLLPATVLEASLLNTSILYAIRKLFLFESQQNYPIRNIQKIFFG
jgi:hypothetical protein